MILIPNPQPVILNQVLFLLLVALCRPAGLAFPGLAAPFLCLSALLALESRHGKLLPILDLKLQISNRYTKCDLSGIGNLGFGIRFHLHSAHRPTA
jgi:hypothetical protein